MNELVEKNSQLEKEITQSEKEKERMRKDILNSGKQLFSTINHQI